MELDKIFIKAIARIAENESVALRTMAFEDECASDDRIDAVLICPGMYPQEIQIGYAVKDFQKLLGNNLDFTTHPSDDYYAVIISPAIEYSEYLLLTVLFAGLTEIS